MGFIFIRTDHCQPCDRGPLGLIKGFNRIRQRSRRYSYDDAIERWAENREKRTGSTTPAAGDQSRGAPSSEGPAWWQKRGPAAGLFRSPVRIRCLVTRLNSAVN